MNPTHAVPLRIAPEHPALPGHFPGAPLVPGVVLLERVAAALAAWRGASVARLDAKFVQPLLPDEAATITLRDEGARVRFEVARAADGCALARGTLTAVPGAADGLNTNMPSTGESTMQQMDKHDERA